MLHGVKMDILIHEQKNSQLNEKDISATQQLTRTNIFRDVL